MNNSTRNCLVLAQYRESSDYNDFIGKYYHFPMKYLKFFNRSNLEFLYYEPSKKDAGVYFGYGRIGKVFEDKKDNTHYFAEILQYSPFASGVPFEDDKGHPRESAPTYNPQNSVRIISAEGLDEICLDGGMMLAFKADAHLVKVLGEELIANEVVGILELVKNSYDACASNCLVLIDNIPNLPACDGKDNRFNHHSGPVIVIEDDGAGISRKSIENGWMRPASTIKTNVKDRLKEEKAKAISNNSLGAFNSFVKELKKHHKGRVPLGEKGVGRFACHRLGSKLLLTTKTVDIDYEYKLEIDWNRFNTTHANGPVDLDSIGISLTRQNISRNYGQSNSGTRLVIFGGKEDFILTEKVIHEINRSLLKLRSPRSSSLEFNVIFKCPQVKDLDITPIEDEFEPVFVLDALVDENGMADIALKFNPPRQVPLPADDNLFPNKVDLRLQDLKAPKYWLSSGINNESELRKTRCGAFYIHMNIWYRSKTWIDGANHSRFTGYLDDFGGISIYRDGINIFPAEWGAEVDWLNLSVRHIKKGINLSYYNIIGNLELEQTVNLDLVDKSDRHGLLKNQAFLDLAALVRNIILRAEVHFTGMRNKYNELTSGLIREPKMLGEVTSKGSALIERISKKYDVVEDALGIVSEFGLPHERKERLINLSSSLKNLKKSIDAITNVQDMLTEQAGYGLAIGVAVHEIAKITSNFYNGISQILDSNPIDSHKLEDLKESSLSLKSELKRLGPFRAIRNEAPSTFDIVNSIIFCESVFKRKFASLNIQFTTNTQNGFNIYARYGAMNQILSNLYDNSCYWLSQSPNKRQIHVEIDSANRRIIMADSGPDIDDSIRPYLFEPGYSLKIPPSGIGLYICKYYINSMRGNIFEAGAKDRINTYPGAQFVLDFSRVQLSGKEL
ncbi:MAG: ATP-binding protein [Nitrospirae bacterium]|nr:ATP-binding protein [Nitrospirota bacterium]